MVTQYKTYIRGFDEALSGGIPEGHVVLISGTAGTMKTSLAHGILWNLARKDKVKSLYISLEQNRKSLELQLASLGMPIDEATSEHYSMLDLALIRKKLASQPGTSDSSWMALFINYIKNLKQTLGFNVLVIDSLHVLDILARFENPREELFHFFEWLKELNVTTFLISEMSQDSNAYSKGEVDFLADGVIHVKLEKVSEIDVQRRIRCVKMRGVNHQTGFFTLLFRDGQFITTRAISE